MIFTAEYSLDDIEEVCHNLLPHLLGQKVLFYAPMGAGKTTLIKNLLKNLDIEVNVQSPTFAIVNEYYSHNIKDYIFHFDLYRIENEQELTQIGFEDYLDAERMVFIEWAERLDVFKPLQALCIEIEIIDSNSRILRLFQLI